MRWPDPAFPQQAHVDVIVADLDNADAVVRGRGARLLLEADDHRTYADGVGHPFCLYPGETEAVGEIARIVFDCFSPRALAQFWSELMDMTDWVVDTPGRVVIARSDRGSPMLGFQHAQSLAPRWPDPDYPQQLHIDIAPTDGESVDTARARALRLGAIKLPHMGGGHVLADPAGHPFCL